MKLAIITCTDGNFLVRSEHDTRDEALIAYDQLHAALVNDKTCAKAVIKKSLTISSMILRELSGQILSFMK